MRLLTNLIETRIDIHFRLIGSYHNYIRILNIRLRNNLFNLIYSTRVFTDRRLYNIYIFYSEVIILLNSL